MISITNEDRDRTSLKKWNALALELRRAASTQDLCKPFTLQKEMANLVTAVTSTLADKVFWPPDRIQNPSQFDTIGILGTFSIYLNHDYRSVVSV